MTLIEPGVMAPPVPGLDLSTGPSALFFYKVTCPVCSLAAPKVAAFEDAYPGRMTGIGQDPPADLRRFAEEHAVGFPSVSDTAPYPLSVAYGLEVVPSIVLVDRGGAVLDTVESWDREGTNRVSRRLAELTGAGYREISHDSDGLPAFRPG